MRWSSSSIGGSGAAVVLALAVFTVACGDEGADGAAIEMPRPTFVAGGPAIGAQAGNAAAPSFGGSAGNPASPPIATAGSAPIAPPMARPPMAAPMPAGDCAVASILKENCQSCHAAKPVAGAPMPLMTYGDLMAPSKSDAARSVAKLVQERVRATGAGLMPPTGKLSESQLAAIDQWMASGSPDCGFTATTPMMSPTNTPGTGAPGMPTGQLEPEECFEFLAHNAQTPNDKSPYMVRPGEFYRVFNFKAPYTKTVKGLSTDPVIDNADVIHHWLLYQVNGTPVADGSHADGLGTHPDGALLAGWAPGGNPPHMPPGVGQELPPVGGSFQLEIHYYNTTGQMQPDRSGLKLCVTSQPVQHTATLATLGSENIIVPAGGQAMATGTCTPGYRNGKREDIHIIVSSPHMHKAGTHMKTVINRMGGAKDILVDKAFSFSDQRWYETPMVVKPGDTLTTTCTFTNKTAGLVTYGPSSDSEMCYNFVLAYPAHALENPGGSLQGAQNTCLR